MKTIANVGTGLVVALLFSGLAARASADDAQALLKRSLEHDPWGMSGASVRAQISLKDKRQTARSLAFEAISKETSKGLANALVRFTAPSELKGAGFLQLQKAEADDERFLFLPELRRSRRISGNLRNTSFMGTDFSFADLDRRDLREGSAVAMGDRVVAGLACSGVKVTPARKDSEYSRIELCIGKDNLLPLEMQMFDRSGTHLKSFVALKVDKVDGKWFITRSTMTNLKHSHVTELKLESIKVVNNVDDAKFTVRELERI